MAGFLDALKERAAFFLIEKADFRPFRTVLQADGEVRDTIGHSEPGSIETQYQLLLKEVQEDLKDYGIKASAVVLTGEGDGHNVVVIEIFSNLREKYQVVFPYTIQGEIVNFGPDLNKGYHTITLGKICYRKD